MRRRARRSRPGHARSAPPRSRWSAGAREVEEQAAVSAVGRRGAGHRCARGSHRCRGRRRRADGVDGVRRSTGLGTPRSPGARRRRSLLLADPTSLPARRVPRRAGRPATRASASSVGWRRPARARRATGSSLDDARPRPTAPSACCSAPDVAGRPRSCRRGAGRSATRSPSPGPSATMIYELAGQPGPRPSCSEVARRPRRPTTARWPARAAPRPGDRRAPARLRPRRLPRSATCSGRRPRRRRRRRRRRGRGRRDRAVPGPRRRARPTRTCGCCSTGTPATAALVFTCNGRGIAPVRRARPRRRGGEPTSIGAGGGRHVLRRRDRPGRRPVSFLHGFTASVALFGEPPIGHGRRSRAHVGLLAHDPRRRGTRDQPELEQRGINVIRGLAMDAPAEANSGHRARPWRSRRWPTCCGPGS